MQSFLVKRHRDAEASAARALDGVDQLDGLARPDTEVLNGLPGPCRSAGRAKWPMPFGTRRRAAAGSNRPSRSKLVFLRPDRRELRNLLVLRHAREQIFHALFNGCCGSR